MEREPVVLVVDDDANLRKTLSDVLNLKGYEATACPSGGDAIRHVETDEISVAVIDLKLDDMSGLELISKVKEIRPTVECIVLTGHASESSAIQAINLGAYSYLRKPLDIDHLLLTIRRAVEKMEADESLRKSEKEKALILNSLSELVVFQSTDQTVNWANKAAADSLGCQIEELRGHRCYELWHKRSTPCEGCPVVKCMETGGTEEAEIASPDGRSW